MDRNKILVDARAEYDIKYENSLYNLYKYLNSQVILLNEVLNTQASICKSKSILAQEGEDIK